MIRTGIVGLGKMGLSHQSMVNVHPEIELKSICDSSGYMLDVLSKYTGVDTYSDYRKMLDRGDLDCVFVATPSRYHAAIVADALERGMHVFCEKPFALEPETGYRLAELAERKHLVNQEMTNGLEANVAARVAADYLASGAVNDKVGDVSKGEYVATLGLAAAQPSPAAWKPRTQVPSGIEADALKAAAKSRTNRRPDRRHPNCGKLRKRDVCNDSQPVSVLSKDRDRCFAWVSDGSRRPGNFRLRPFDLPQRPIVPALLRRHRSRL